MKIKFWLVLILVLAALLRIWNISNNPPGLTWDEAALGYNSYSLIFTGKDEYGTLLPLNLKSFGDYKPALYAYLDIPFIAVFGLSEFAVRLPSVLAGILIVLIVFLLINEIFKNKLLAIVSSFFVAVSPFAIQFSRPAFEANIAMLLNLLGVYLLIKGKENKKLLFISIVVFVLSLLTYQSSRVFVPLMVLGLFFIYKKEIGVKNLRLPIVVFFFLFVLIMSAIFLTGQSSRFSTLNYFAYQRSSDEIKMISNEDRLALGRVPFQIIHGEWWAYARGLFERYLLYFSPRMLTIDGDYDQRHRVSDQGPMYYFSILLLPLGLVYFLNQKGLGSKLLFTWLLLAPVPAVLSRDLLNLVRALNLMIPLEILQAGGLVLIIENLKNKKILLKGFLVFAVLIFIYNFFIYIDRYFVHASKEYSQYWLYGYKQAVNTLNTLTENKKYDHIVITDFYGQPYIYYLFYTKYPPQKYQQQASLEQKTVDVGTVRKIDNIEFRHVYWPADRGAKNSLFIGSKEELPDKDIKPFPEYAILKDINFLDNEPAFRIVETK